MSITMRTNCFKKIYTYQLALLSPDAGYTIPLLYAKLPSGLTSVGLAPSSIFCVFCQPPKIQKYRQIARPFDWIKLPPVHVKMADDFKIFHIAFNSLVAAFLFFAAWIYLKTKKKNSTLTGIVTNNSEIKVSRVESEKQQQNSEPTIEPIRLIPKAEKQTKSNKCANNCDNSENLKPCSRCRKVFYCGKVCQLQHWKKGGHKKTCIAETRGVNKNENLKSKSERGTENETGNETYGATKSEREELVNELQELSKEEREMLLSQWDQMSPDQLLPPSLIELEQLLTQHRKEMSGLMYKAAYESMDEESTKQMVNRMKELKELIKLQEELVECHQLEVKTIQQQEAAKIDNGNFYTCMPCGPVSEPVPAKAQESSRRK